MQTCLGNQIQQGALAHLARAFDWQSKGDEFDSRMLHWKDSYNGCLFLFTFIYGNHCPTKLAHNHGLHIPFHAVAAHYPAIGAQIGVSACNEVPESKTADWRVALAA